MITPGTERRTTMWGQLRRPQESGTRLVQRLINTLVTQPHRPIVRELRPKMATDLLRAPPLPEKLEDNAVEPHIHVNC